jgi:hypothetical protein
MADADAGSLVRRVCVEQEVRRVYRSQISGVIDLIEQPEPGPKGDAGLDCLTPALVGQRDAMVGDPADRFPRLVVEEEAVGALRDVTDGFAVADEHEECGAGGGHVRRHSATGASTIEAHTAHT